MVSSTALPAGSIARGVGVETQFRDLRNNPVNFLPQRIAIIGQGNSASTYTTEKRQVFSAFEVGERYGFGSPVHLAAKQVLPAFGGGVGTIPVTIYPLQDASSAVAATGTLTATGTATEDGTFQIKLGNELTGAVAVSDGDDASAVATAMAAAINGATDVPVTASASAGVVTNTAKWEGSGGNSITAEIVGDLPAGIAVAITAYTSGDVNPDLATATNQFGETWETLVIPCFNVGAATPRDFLMTFNETRWDDPNPRFFVALWGESETTVANATVISSTRTSDRTNGIVNVPGSSSLPWVIAAAAVAEVAVRANDNPPYDYGRLPLRLIDAGTDGEQFDFNERNASLLGGAGTTELRDNVVTLSDVITFYAPSGQPTPAYRYVVDIVRLQNIVYNIRLLFDNEEWDGAPLVNDDDPIGTNPATKKPRMAVAEVAGLMDALAENAIIADLALAKASIVASIDAQNPKRLNLNVTVKLSGNTNQIANTLYFGFNFG